MNLQSSSRETPRRVLSKARRSAVALGQPPADALAAWYLRRLGRRLRATQRGVPRELVEGLRPVLQAGLALMDAINEADRPVHPEDPSFHSCHHAGVQP